MTPALATRLAAAIPRRWQWALAIALVVAAVAYAFWSLQTRVRPWSDFGFVYAAGRSWLGGFSPYDFPRWNAEWVAIRNPETYVAQPMPFMYPPYWAPIAVAMAALPWPVASRVWDALNVVSVFGLCALCLALLAPRVGGRWEGIKKPSVWVFVALAIFNPAVRYSIWQSQMTILPTLGAAGLFWAWHEKRTGLTALFGFVAALKPQIGFLPLFYVFLNGGHVGLLAAAAAAAAIGIVAMVPSGLGALPAHLANSYRLHMQVRFNRPEEFSSVPAIAGAWVSGHVFMVLGLTLAMAAVVVVTLLRRRDARLQHASLPSPLQSPLWQLSLVMAAAGALMPVHGYDLVIYVPLVFLAYELRSSWSGPVLVALVLCAGRPGFFLRFVPIPQLASYLTGAVFLVLLSAAARGVRAGR